MIELLFTMTPSISAIEAKSCIRRPWGSVLAMKFRVFLVCGIALLSSSCGGPTLVGGPSLTVVQGTELPSPQNVDLVASGRPYIIGPYDRIEVAVFGLPELTRRVQIDANGRFALPLAGEFQASGTTPAQLTTMIEQRLRDHSVREPQVAINVETVNQMITVDGEVKTPGLYPVTGRMTLMRSIARAEGVTEFAATNFVVVFRRVGNQDLAALYDLRAIRAGIYADPEVYANDVVFVGESRARRLFSTLIQSSALLTAPIIALLQR